MSAVVGVCAHLGLSSVSALRFWRNPYLLPALFLQNAAWAVLLETILTRFLCVLFIRSLFFFLV